MDRGIIQSGRSWTGHAEYTHLRKMDRLLMTRASSPRRSSAAACLGWVLVLEAQLAQMFATSSGVKDAWWVTSQLLKPLGLRSCEAPPPAGAAPCLCCFG